MQNLRIFLNVLSKLEILKLLWANKKTNKEPCKNPGLIYLYLNFGKKLGKRLEDLAQNRLSLFCTLQSVMWQNKKISKSCFIDTFLSNELKLTNNQESFLTILEVLPEEFGLTFFIEETVNTFLIFHQICLFTRNDSFVSEKRTV